MKGKIGLVVGGAVGYVLGTRAGRERYEQIMAQAKGLWQNPRVQEAAQHAPSRHRDSSGVTPPSETYPNAGSPPGDVGV